MTRTFGVSVSFAILATSGVAPCVLEAEKRGRTPLAHEVPKWREVVRAANIRL